MTNRHKDLKCHLLVAAVLMLLLLAATSCLTSAEESAATVSNRAGTAAGDPQSAPAVKHTADKLPDIELAHATLPVSGMTCGNCEQAIQRSVGKLVGVSMVMASFADGRVEVDYDPQQVGEPEIVAEIEKLQYKVETPQAAGSDAADSAEDQEVEPNSHAGEGESKAENDSTESKAGAENDGTAGSVDTEDPPQDQAPADSGKTGSDVKECGECDGECEGGEGCAVSEETQAAEEGGGGCAGCAKEAAGFSAPADVPAGLERLTLRIEQMTCAGKSGWVNKTVGGLDGVGGCYADESTLTAVIDYDPAKWDAAKLIEKINADSDGFFTATEI